MSLTTPWNELRILTNVPFSASTFSAYARVTDILAFVLYDFTTSPSTISTYLCFLFRRWAYETVDGWGFETT